MGPIRDGKMVEFHSMIKNDTNHTYIRNAEGLPPVYIIEGLPGNAYKYETLNDDEFSNFTLKHEVYKDPNSLGYC